MTTFDYTNQCWIVDGIVQECAHTWDIDCGCYGRKHAGETVPVAINASKISRKVWTKASVKAWLVACEPKADCSKTRAAITKALLFMYARQTADEQNTLSTNQSNGVGFTGVDAEFLSSVAEKCIQYKRDISPKQFVYVRRKLVKYSGQLVTFANSL